MMNNNFGMGGFEMSGFGMGGFWMIVIYVAVIVVPFYQLWKRTGHNGWMALLMLIPLVNVIMLYVLAFKQWPALPDRKG